MSDPLVLQQLLTEPTLWQIHNCKIPQVQATYDAPLPLLAQYDSLNDDIKDAHPLSFEQLKQMNSPMSTAQAAQFLNIDWANFKKSWQIKYIGIVVIFCDSLQLALRLHFSNTAKTAQAVYVTSQDEAISDQADKWQVFGVVDILYKGTLPLVSHADDELIITNHPSYQALPSSHSLSVSMLINNAKGQFDIIQTAISERLTSPS